MFAIADTITQSVLAPLHDAIFRLLRRLPMDGTFNQDAPVSRLLRRVRDGDLVSPTFYSYDLSSATDRLPVALQQQILSALVGIPIAEY